MRAWQRPQRTAPITSRRVTKRTRTSDLQGIVGPLQAWAALRASSIERRFEALHTAGLTTLMGGKKNSNCCCAAGRETNNGEGQVVLLEDSCELDAVFGFERVG